MSWSVCMVGSLPDLSPSDQCEEVMPVGQGLFEHTSGILGAVIRLDPYIKQNAVQLNVRAPHMGHRHSNEIGIRTVCCLSMFRRGSDGSADPDGGIFSGESIGKGGLPVSSASLIESGSRERALELTKAQIARILPLLKEPIMNVPRRPCDIQRAISARFSTSIRLPRSNKLSYLELQFRKHVQPGANRKALLAMRDIRCLRHA